MKGIPSVSDRSGGVDRDLTRGRRYRPLDAESQPQTPPRSGARAGPIGIGWHRGDDHARARRWIPAGYPHPVPGIPLGDEQRVCGAGRPGGAGVHSHGGATFGSHGRSACTCQPGSPAHSARHPAAGARRRSPGHRIPGRPGPNHCISAARVRLRPPVHPGDATPGICDRAAAHDSRRPSGNAAVARGWSADVPSGSSPGNADLVQPGGWRDVC